MRTFVLTFALATSAVAQSATVSTTADSGPGSLRAAILAANASGATTFAITVDASATAGSIVLGSLLPKIFRSDVTITAGAGAGRLRIDARNVTPPGGFALGLAGARIAVLAPCTVLVGAGTGVLVEGDDARLADVEANANFGNTGPGLVVNPGADGLIVGRFVADRFTTGVHLNACSGARIADDGAAVATFTNLGGAGLLITGGGDHAIGSFVCSIAEVAMLATNVANLAVGRAGSPRSLVTGCRRQGLVLQNCSSVALTNSDLLGNGTVDGPAVAVVGGSGYTVTDLHCEANRSGGLVFGDGVSRVRVGPGVTTRGPSPAGDIGLAVRGASVVTVVDCQFGPDHAFGVALQPDGVGPPTNVTVCRSAIVGNRTAGLLANRCFDSLLSSTFVAGNLGPGVQASAPGLASAPVRFTVAGSVLTSNVGGGLLAQNADTLRIGPGDRIDDNLDIGVAAYSSVGVSLDNAVSVHRNRNGGVTLVDCDNAKASRATLRENRGTGIYALRCNSFVVGPDVAVRDTIGNGIMLENSSGCRVESTQITASSAQGLVVFTIGPVPSVPHVVQSVLLADHPGLAMFVGASQPVVCQLATIAGNLRGVFNDSPLTLDSCVVHGNLLQDFHPNTALTVRNTFHLNPTPAAGSSNTNLNPFFAAPSLRDWRLQPTSPAIGYANAQTVVVAPGATDAFGGPRVVGALDAGAFEVGPHPAEPARLVLSSATMPNGGGGLAFHARHPASAAGGLALLLLEIGPPSGSFQVLGGTIPLGLTPGLFVATGDSLSVNTIAPVAADGTVDGALLWGGRLVPSVQNQGISLCSVVLDATPAIASVTNVATFTIQ